MTYKGVLTITRRGGTSAIVVDITDDNGTLIVQAELSAEKLGMALTGLSNVDCNYSIWPQTAGKVLEKKEEFIPDSGRKSKEEVDALFAPYEIDGWIAYKNDYGNHHCLKNGMYRVSFARYVDPQ